MNSQSTVWLVGIAVDVKAMAEMMASMSDNMLGT